MGIKMQNKKRNAAMAKAKAMLQTANEAAAAGNTALATDFRAQAITLVEGWAHKNPQAQAILTEAKNASSTTKAADIEIIVEAIEDNSQAEAAPIAAAAAPAIEDLKAQAAEKAAKAKVAAAAKTKANAASATKKAAAKKTTWKKKN